MSRTMKDDAIRYDRSTNMDRDGAFRTSAAQVEQEHRAEVSFLESQAFAAARKSDTAMAAGLRLHQSKAILDDHCDHSNLNAAGNRCLSCGMWAHQFIALPVTP